MSSDICDLSAADLAAAIRDKQISPVEAVDASLARIEAVQPALNAFCFVYADEARDLAKKAEAKVMNGDDLGALHGVPIAIKDFTPTKGKRTTRGSYTHEHWVPDWDPVMVQRLALAGAIMVGKTTTPEFAYSSFTKSPLWGETRNPWNTDKSPGGSSGGAGAAVATGCVPLAEGTDMGGSVRIPAALCGVVGFKPSLGRIPMDILSTVFDSISHFGPLSRTIDDAALFLRVTEGPDDADIQSQVASLPLPDRLDGDVTGLRIALDIDVGIYIVDAEVEANLRAVATALADAGAVVDEVPLDWTPQAVADWMAYWQVFLAAAAGDLVPEYRDRMDPNVVALIEAGQRIDAVTFKRLEDARTKQWQALARIFANYDALLCPTMAQPAPDNDSTDAKFEGIDSTGKLRGLDMTAPFNNVSQCPALSVPSGWTKDGLPTSAQIITRRFDDGMALCIGAAIEKLCPWSGRRPPVLERIGAMPA